MPDTLERDTVGALERRARQAQALVDVSRDIRYDQPLSDVLASLAANIVEHTRASSVAATLLDPADLSSIAYGEANVPEGYTDAMIALRQEPREAAQIRRAVAEGRTWVLRDARNSLLSRPAYAPMADMIRQVTWETVVGTAFEYRPEAMAVVYLCYDGDVDVDDEEVSFARSIAYQTAPAMDNAWLFSEAQRRTAEMEALHRADTALNQSLHLQDVLETMTELAVDLIGADATVLATWGSDGLLHVASSRGMSTDRAAALEERYRVFDRGPQPFAGSREAALIEDAANDWRVDAEMRALSDVESIAVLTVYAGDNVFGFFHLGWRKRHRFTASDEWLLRALTVRAGLAVQNALVFEQSNDRADQLAITVSQLEALRRADAALHESLRLQDVLQTMADLAVDLLGADKSIFGWWGTDGEATIPAARGFDAATLARIEQRYRELGLRGYGADTPPQTTLIEDVGEGSQADPELGRIAGVTSVAALSILVNGEHFGFLQIGYRERHSFTAEDARLFDQLGSRAGLAIQNALSFQDSVSQAEVLDANVRQLEALHRADAAMHESLRLEDVLEAMAALAIDLLGADQSALVTRDDAGRLTVSAARGLTESQVETLSDAYRVYEGEGFPEGIPRSALVEDVRSQPSIPEPLRLTSPSESLVELPVVVGKELFGFFTIGYSERRSFDVADRRLFDTLATRASLAIQNALSFEASVSQAEVLDANVRQLEALHRADTAMHESLRLQDVYQAMAELAVDLLGADSGIIGTADGRGRTIIRASRGLNEHQVAALNAVYQAQPLYRYLEAPATLQLVEDVREHAGTPAVVHELQIAGAYADIPILVGGEVYAFFIAGYASAREFTGDDRRLFDTLATRAGLAIQNALLYEQIAAQAVELEAQIRQLEGLRTIAANLTLDPGGTSVYDELAEQVVRATSAQSCAVTVLEGDHQDVLRMLGTAGLPPGFALAMDEAYALGAPSRTLDFVARQELQIVRDARAQAFLDERFAAARALLADSEWDTMVSLPLVYRDRVLGMLVAGYPTDWEVDDRELTFLRAIADQGAVALENARLMEAASTLATVEERQRLARELHDSVSQALYGIALGARTARRRLGETGDPLVVEAVEYVLALAEAGLTETRALIFELIPESLANEGLAVAVKRQAAAIQARHQIPVHIDLGDEPDLPLKTKEAIYRIAQESLNNLAKHAKAENAYVTLASVDGLVRLEVRDDGAGFDPTGDFPGHLGLISMQERARRVGATYAIESSPGKGATVTLTVATT